MLTFKKFHFCCNFSAVLQYLGIPNWTEDEEAILLEKYKKRKSTTPTNLLSAEHYYKFTHNYYVFGLREETPKEQGDHANSTHRAESGLKSPKPGGMTRMC